MPLKLAGVFSAALTPMRDDLSPDHAEHVAHCKRLLELGCDGLAPLGTSGELASFSAAERMGILEALLKGGISPDVLMPGTGTAALSDTIALTRHAVALGVTTVLMIPPFYYKTPSDDGLFGSYARIVEAVGDARLRIVLYHIPQTSAVPLSLSLIARLRSAFPGVFAGIKDSSGDFANMSGLVDRFPGFAVFGGAEHLVQSLMAWGGAGCITGNSNLIAPDLAFVYRNYADPAKAAEVMAVQKRLARTRATLLRFTQIPAMKAVLAARTGNKGWYNVRPPFVPYTAETAGPIVAALAAVS